MRRWAVFTCLLLLVQRVAPLSLQQHAKPSGATSSKRDAAMTRSRPRAVVHIGPHKTASSTIQKYLTDNRVELAANHSIYFLGDCPKSDALFVNQHLRRMNVPRPVPFLSPSCKMDVPDYLRELRFHASSPISAAGAEEKQSRVSTVLLSAEALENLDAYGLQTLRSLLADYDVEIVFFFRETVSRLYSFFTQVAKGNAWKPRRKVHMFFDEFYRRINDSEYRSAHSVLKDFANTFGFHAIRVVDYNGALAQGVEPHQVMACDILHTCRTGTKGNSGINEPPKSIKVNIGVNMISRQLFSIFYDTAIAQGCSTNKTFIALAAIYYPRLAKMSQRVPVKRVYPNEELIRLSIENDAIVRATYGPLLYPIDTSHGPSHISNFSYVEVNRAAFAEAAKLSKSKGNASRGMHAFDSNVHLAIKILNEMRSMHLVKAVAAHHFYGCVKVK
jgi:hypothetical protein